MGIVPRARRWSGPGLPAELDHQGLQQIRQAGIQRGILPGARRDCRVAIRGRQHDRGQFLTRTAFGIVRLPERAIGHVASGEPLPGVAALFFDDDPLLGAEHRRGGSVELGGAQFEDAAAALDFVGAAVRLKVLRVAIVARSGYCRPEPRLPCSHHRFDR